MKDRILDRRVSDLQELIELWDRFHRMIESASKGASFTEEHEREFLNIKSSIARKFQGIADKFERKTFPEEELTNVLSEAISLKQASKMSSFTVGQLENTWHRVYISLNKIVGHLESEREALAKLSGVRYGVGRVFRNKLFVFLLVIAILAAAGFFGFKYYVNLLKPAIEQIEKEEAGEEIEPGTEASQSQVELVKLVRKIMSKIRGTEVEGEAVEGEPAQGVMNWYYLACGLFGAIICGVAAKKKKRSAIGWAILGFVVGSLGFYVARLFI